MISKVVLLLGLGGLSLHMSKSLINFLNKGLKFARL